EAPPATRWTALGKSIATGLEQTAMLSVTKRETTAGIPYVYSADTDRAVLLGLPLWPRTITDAVPELREARQELAEQHGQANVAQGDVFEAARRPLQILRRLVE